MACLPFKDLPCAVDRFGTGAGAKTSGARSRQLRVKLCALAMKDAGTREVPVGMPPYEAGALSSLGQERASVDLATDIGTMRVFLYLP